MYVLFRHSSLLGYNTFKSPHYNDSHRAFRAKVRAFMDKEVNPFVGEVRGVVTPHSLCHRIIVQQSLLPASAR